MKYKQRTLLSCAISSLLGVGATALAQDTSTLEEIVVTAQKRSESLQDVPVAVSAFTGEMRDIIGITTISDLADFTPGLQQNTTQDRIALRGIGRLTNNYGSDPGVANYSDGFYTASTVEAGKRQILIDRVEVLRGPQGTLYGRNSIGGAINILSKRPTEAFEGEVRATAGNYDTTFFDGSFSGPVTDWMRFRVAGYYGGQGRGFFENVGDGTSEGNVAENTWVEGQLEFDIGENIEAWVKYSHVEWNESRRTSVQITPYDIAPIYFSGLSPTYTFNGPLPPASPAFTTVNPSIADHRIYDTDTHFQTNLDDVDIVTAEVVAHLGFADLKYVGGYQGYTYDQVSDFDGTSRLSYNTFINGQPFTMFTQIEAFYLEDKEYHSNELNLISTSDGPFQWIVGLYQYHEDVYNDQGIRSRLQPQLASPINGAANSNPDRNYQIAGVHLVADAYAGFGQADYAFNDQWKVTLGARYTEDEKDGTEFRTRVVFGAPAAALGLGPPFTTAGAFAVYNENRRNRDLAGKWNATTGTAGLEWTPNDDTLAFAKYTRGYKSGGFNGGAFADQPYTEPEFVNAYELGVKQTFFNSLLANVSVFYYDYKDAQIPLGIVDPVTSLTTQQFFNIEKSEVMGAELESVWQATDALQLRLTYAYLDAEIKSDLCVTDPADARAFAAANKQCGALTGTGAGARQRQSLNGNKLPSAPENKIAANANYTWELAAGTLTASTTWTYRDDMYSAVFTSEHWRVPSYDETDVRLLWNDPDNHYTIIAFCQNVFDDEGFERIGASESAWETQTPFQQNIDLHFTAPRTYGVEVQFRFGN